jgi:uncharacterized protein (DUF2141 family)
VNILLWLVFLSQLSAAPREQAGRLDILITNIKPLKGDLYVMVHRKAENFFIADSALARQKVRVTEDSHRVIFEDLSPGRLAVAVYHDENLNGTMDVNEIGFPREGYGFSNNPPGPGRPKFTQAAFDFNGDDRIGIKMVYHPVPPPKKK